MQCDNVFVSRTSNKKVSAHSRDDPIDVLVRFGRGRGLAFGLGHVEDG